MKRLYRLLALALLALSLAACEQSTPAYRGKLPVAVADNDGYSAVIYCADWPKGR